MGFRFRIRLLRLLGLDKMKFNLYLNYITVSAGGWAVGSTPSARTPNGTRNGTRKMHDSPAANFSLPETETMGPVELEPPANFTGNQTGSGMSNWDVNGTEIDFGDTGYSQEGNTIFIRKK